MARCGFCGATELAKTVDGLEPHRPGFKLSSNSRPCSGYATYLERDQQVLTKTPTR